MHPTPVHGHEPIDMLLVGSIGEIKKRGDFCWHLDDKGRRKCIIAIPVKPMPGSIRNWFACEWTINHSNESGAQWAWDGELAKPTLKPSLHWVGVWHGFVRKGQLIEAK